METHLSDTALTWLGGKIDHLNPREMKVGWLLSLRSWEYTDFKATQTHMTLVILLDNDRRSLTLDIYITVSVQSRRAREISPTWIEITSDRKPNHHCTAAFLSHFRATPSKRL